MSDPRGVPTGLDLALAAGMQAELCKKLNDVAIVSTPHDYLAKACVNVTGWQVANRSAILRVVGHVVQVNFFTEVLYQPYEIELDDPSMIDTVATMIATHLCKTTLTGDWYPIYYCRL